MLVTSSINFKAPPIDMQAVKSGTLRLTNANYRVSARRLKKSKRKRQDAEGEEYSKTAPKKISGHLSTHLRKHEQKRGPQSAQGQESPVPAKPMPKTSPKNKQRGLQRSMTTRLLQEFQETTGPKNENFIE